MKKVIAGLICFCIMLAGVNVFADENIVNVLLDGQIMQFDVPARIYDGRTMVPMRAVFEKLGAEVRWLEEDELIFAVRGDTVITMKIGQDFCTVQNLLSADSNTVKLDVAPMIVSDRTLVPIRAVAESLGCLVEWDGANNKVLIDSHN